MKKINYWDRTVSRWMLRHFYFLFFQIVLVIVFIFWFINTIKMIDIGFELSKNNTVEHIMMNQCVNTSIIILLMLLNSFWLLYIFNTIKRLTNVVRDVNYTLGRMKNKQRKNPNS
jgi:hypothetical protein